MTKSPLPWNECCNLQDLLEIIEDVTGLDIAVYPPDAREVSPAIEGLPLKYHRHASPFCLAVRQTSDGKGCRGHDAVHTNRLAASIGHPFVQICHAGAAEVIVPVFSNAEHLCTIFIGQAVIESVEAEGFAGIWERIGNRGCVKAAVQTGFSLLPRMTDKRLLQIGRLAEAAVRGLAEKLSAKAFAHEVRLQNAPAVLRALEILRADNTWTITEREMAQRVHLTHIYFCRLFHKVMGCGYNDYITKQRLLRAQNLLQHTDLPIGEIASNCGFSRQSYFTRRFRELMGKTPGEFRKKR